MNVAQLVIKCLENEGVQYMFGIPACVQTCSQFHVE